MRCIAAVDVSRSLASRNRSGAQGVDWAGPKKIVVGGVLVFLGMIDKREIGKLIELE